MAKIHRLVFQGNEIHFGEYEATLEDLQEQLDLKIQVVSEEPEELDEDVLYLVEGEVTADDIIDYSVTFSDDIDDSESDLTYRIAATPKALNSVYKIVEEKNALKITKIDDFNELSEFANGIVYFNVE